MNINEKSSLMTRRVVILSILLIFFSLPHTLEDFATGEPVRAGIPAPVLSLVVATIFSLQALGLYWLGQANRKGFLVHILVGLFWPLASGLAQLPTILSGVPYREGFISVFYVGGIIVVGLLLFFFSINALRSDINTQL
ncbi:MAG: hypothetical protein JSV42_14635 [Chloroflexota bacterium]|nr:MAG: hypothetical protein JSV42_14635 [Chloroflexota bacterium]